MKKITLLVLLLTNLILFSQNRETEQILNEGKLLFRLEKGSWYGTDHMLETLKPKRDSIGGYLSYETSNHKINTIFFSRYDPKRILIRYQFDSLPKPVPISVDTTYYRATEFEKDLISIRQDAHQKVFSNTNDFFNFYKNTSFNFIPIISGKQRNVFVVTANKLSDTVLIGNDYKLTYDKNNRFIKKEKMHNSLLKYPYKSKDKSNPLVSTIHSHVLTEHITSTDICTLLLYKNFVEWNQHIVAHEKKVSIFDLISELLFTMKRKNWEKIFNSE